MQDTWRVGDRLTINPGIRYEQQTLVGHAGRRVPAEEQLGAAHRRRLRRARQRHESKLYGNYGRFFARIPNDLAARALSATPASPAATTSTPA